MTIGQFSFVRRWFIQRLARVAPSVQELHQDVREQMAATALAGHPSLFTGMFESVLASGPFGKHAQRRLMLLLGENDPLITEAALRGALHDLDLSAMQIVRLATGGHYPHLESADHPEWTARNIAEIVYIIGQMSLASSQVEGGAIVDADTMMHSSQISGNDSTILV